MNLETSSKNVLSQVQVLHDPDSYTFPWVLTSAYPIGTVGTGASISQRTVQNGGLAGVRRIVWS
jgi:hypothetical protein